MTISLHLAILCTLIVMVTIRFERVNKLGDADGEPRTLGAALARTAQLGPTKAELRDSSERIGSRAPLPAVTQTGTESVITESPSVLSLDRA